MPVQLDPGRPGRARPAYFDVSRPAAMSWLRLPSLALVALVVPVLAGATTVRTGQPAASQPAARVFATRAQLRDCLDTEAALKTRFHAIEASNDAHEQMFNQVEAENARLLEVQAQLDRDSNAAVDAFNALAKDHNLHVKKLNQDAADTQPANDVYNADMSAYNRKCSALVYRVDDLDAVLKERRKASAQAGAASAP